MSLVLPLTSREVAQSRFSELSSVDDITHRRDAYESLHEFIMRKDAPSDRELEALITVGDRILSQRPDNIRVWNLNDIATAKLTWLRDDFVDQPRASRVLQKFTEMIARANAALKMDSRGYSTLRLFRSDGERIIIDDIMNGKIAYKDASPMVIATAVKRLCVELKISNIANLIPQETDRSVEDFVRDLRDLNADQRNAFFAFASLLRNVYGQRIVNGMDENQLIGSMPGVPRDDLDLMDPEVRAGFVRHDPSCYQYGINDILGLKNPQELRTLLENLDEIQSRMPALQSAE